MTYALVPLQKKDAKKAPEGALDAHITMRVKGILYLEYRMQKCPIYDPFIAI